MIFLRFRAVCDLSSRVARNEIFTKLRYLQSNRNIKYEQRATLFSIYTMPDDYQRRAPFPYKEKKFRVWNALFDETMHRFDENTKLVTVDGPLCSGKTAVAKTIAKTFDMYHIPEVHSDMLYVTEYGFDTRLLDPQLPASCKSFDEEKFHQNPHHPLCTRFQMEMLILRFEQHVDALAHIFNTGQGVVLERSIYTDFVFLEAMIKCGYIPQKAREFSDEIKETVFQEVQRPHIAIYLDVPVPEVERRIKARGKRMEVNSNALNRTFLEEMDHQYRNVYLPTIGKHAHLFVYDCSEGADGELIVEDMERVDYDDYEKYTEKLDDWCFSEPSEYEVQRFKFTNEKEQLLDLCVIPRFDIPEILISGEDNFIMDHVYQNAPGCKYMSGFNADVGDKGIWWKMNPRNWSKGVVHDGE